MNVQQCKQKLDFQGDPIYVGIDVHKKQWNVFIMSGFKEHKGFVQPPDASVLGRYLRENFPGAIYHSVYEAGFCGFSAHEHLMKEGIHNIVVNPADVPSKDKEKKQKTDRVDSRKLCKKLRDGDLEPIHIPERFQLEDRDLVRVRKKLVRDVTRCKNRIKGMLHFYGITYTSSGWSRAFMKWLKELELDYASGTFALHTLVEELERVQELKKKVSNQLIIIFLKNEKYSKIIRRLCSISGIGLTAAITILTELVEMCRFKRFDYLCNYVGLVPTVYSTGDTKYVGNLTPRKNTYLLPVLIQCSWIAVGKDPALMQAYHQWCRRMKGQKAIIRVARKLLRRIRHVWLCQDEYQLRTVS
jgi:transposase